MLLALKHNLTFHRCSRPLVPTDTQTAQILISRLCSNAGAAFQNAPWKETFTHYFCTCHPEMWWWGWSKWKWQQNWAPPLFPLFNFTLCTGVWTARFTEQGHTFPHTAFPSSKENEDGAETSPNTLIFLFVAPELLQIYTLTLNDYMASATKTCHQRIPIFN